MQGNQLQVRNQLQPRPRKAFKQESSIKVARRHTSNDAINTSNSSANKEKACIKEDLGNCA